MGSEMCIRDRINGDDKAKILLEEGLIKVVLPKPPEPEPEPEAEAEGSTDEAAADDEPAAEEDKPEAE